MASLIYIHGFLSSPQSFKAQQVKTWLASHRPDIQYHCPFLPPYPAEAQKILEHWVESLPRPIYLMGSSLGGYWCSWLVEKYDLRAVLINPAVQPSMLIPEFIGAELKNYHTEDTYTLTAAHVDQIKAVDTEEIRRTDHYWVLLQTEDETLDYRLAAAKYKECRLLIEEGGDHGFQGFERHIPASIAFLEQGADTEEPSIR